jgi:hypothetical protein
VFRHACKMASKRKGPRSLVTVCEPQLNSIGLARTYTAAPGFRTIQASPKDLLVLPRQAERAVS